MARLALLLAGLVVAGLSLAAQSPRFDVASIKRSAPILDRQLQPFVGIPQPGFWRVHDLPIASAVLNLYPGYPLSIQLVGAPEWFDSREWYDIEARTNPSATAEGIRQMGRALLAERFKLALHNETREVPAFVLVKRNDAKLGSGLKLPALDCAAFRAGGERPRDPAQKSADRLPCAAISLPLFEHLRLVPGADTRITAGDVPISGILTLLANRLKRPVIDQTGLTQRFDIELQFTADPLQSIDGGPAIRTAITEQLGLQVQEGRAPIDVLVIDHIERPTPD